MIFTHPSIIGILGNVNVLTYFQSDLKSYIDPNTTGRNLIDLIDQSQQEQKIYIISSNETNINIYLDKHFDDELERIVPDGEIRSRIIELIRSNKQDNYDLHKIDKDPNKVNVSSYIFSNLKYDKIWNFGLFKYGSPYFNLTISNKLLILLDSTK